MSRLFTWGARRSEGPALAASAPRITEVLATSRALPKFLAALTHQPAPVLLDLGPVVGTNESFFGDRLSCRMVIEDLHDAIEASARRGDTDGLGDTLAARLTAAAPELVDGVLCWDLFDYFDRPTARVVAARLRGLLRPKGVVHGFFGTTSATLESRTKFIVQSDTTIKCRLEPAAPVHRYALQTGEIARLFEGLTVIESVLLQNKTRESLFRKG